MSKSPFAFIQDKILVMLALLSKHNTKCVTQVTRKVLNVFSLGCIWSSFESPTKASFVMLHSALINNQTKVLKIKKVPLQGDKAWSRDPKSALFEILHNKEHFY